MGRRRNIAHLAAVLGTAGMVLAACNMGEYGGKETVGTLLGAAGGAIAGSQIGSGSGQIVAIAAGTMIGAFVGNEIGKSLDRADQLAMSNAQQQAMAAPVGETITWRNPETGNHGSVVATREGTAGNGNYCREYQHTITVGGETEEAYGIACRQPDGSWKVASN